MRGGRRGQAGEWRSKRLPCRSEAPLEWQVCLPDCQLLQPKGGHVPWELGALWTRLWGPTNTTHRGILQCATKTTGASGREISDKKHLRPCEVSVPLHQRQAGGKKQHETAPRVVPRTQQIGGQEDDRLDHRDVRSRRRAGSGL